MLASETKVGQVQGNLQRVDNLHRDGNSFFDDGAASLISFRLHLRVEEWSIAMLRLKRQQRVQQKHRVPHAVCVSRSNRVSWATFNIHSEIKEQRHRHIEESEGSGCRGGCSLLIESLEDIKKFFEEGGLSFSGLSPRGKQKMEHERCDDEVSFGRGGSEVDVVLVGKLK